MQLFVISLHVDRTPVHAAAYNDQCDSLQMLLNHGGDVNRKDDHERTPLMYAAMNGQSAAIGELEFIYHLLICLFLSVI